MVRPTKPKEIKPKADISADSPVAAPPGVGGGINGTKLIIINIFTTILISVLFLAGNYFIIQSSMSKIAGQMTQGDNGDGSAQSDSSGGGADGGDQVEHGVILDLGEFILNLSDPHAKRYLKISVAIELSHKDTDPKTDGPAKEGEDPAKAIEAEMSDYKPAIRDAIISTLSSKTAEELSSVEGKDQSKEQIKEAVNAIFGGEREVIRVSFGSFIIQ